MEKHSVLWYAADGECLPWWYKRFYPPRNLLWRFAVDRLVYDDWMVAMRCFYLMGGSRASYPTGLTRFATVVQKQIGIQEAVHMARSEKRSIAVVGWANIVLNEDDKEAISSAEIAVETLFQDLGALVFSGYRFSVTYDEYSKALQATLVCVNPEDGNYEYGLSARHPDPVVALKTLLYKHNLTRDTGWRDYVTGPRVDSWG